MVIAILSVIAYYVDIAGTPQVRLISLEKLSGSHGGENQAILMAKVIRKYGLEKKIGFFTADNADPCDTCVRALLKMFNPRASPTGLEGLEGERRIRCVGHILNLSAKAFLEGDSSDIFDSHIAEKDQKKERELLCEWRKRGPLGKLHNLVHWIRRSPQRRELFLSRAARSTNQSWPNWEYGLMVKADNDTRWNSAYLMVHRALRLRDIIDVFCKLSLLDPKEEKRVSAEDVLSCEDWVVLAEIIEILQPYLTYTKHFEGRTPRFAEVLPTMYLLKDHLSEMRQRYSSNLIPAPYRAPRITLEEPREQQGGLQQDTGVSTWGRYSTMESTTSGEPSSPLYQAEISVQFEDKDLDPEPFELSDDGLHFIQHSIKYAMSKLDKYRNLMERSVVYWAAMILHPGYGIGFLQLRLPNQVDSILRDFRDYFDRHYAQGNQAPVSPDSPPAFHGSKLLLRNANFPKKARKEAPDEINLYLQMVPEEDFKEEQLLQWWLGRKTQFPRLFNMAMDLLSISAMSSENERVFSAAKLTISSQRNALHWVTVEALQCLRNWARTGAISWAKPRGHQDTMLTLPTRALTPSSSSTPSISRPKTSPVWEYCRIEEGKTTPAAWVDSNGTKWWHCQPCFDKKREKKYNYSGGSSTIVNHLRKQHKILISGRQEIRREVTQNRLGDITAFLANEKQHSSKKRKATAEADALDQATLRELYCRYTVACSLPFAHVEQPAFRDFIRYICPAADDFLPRSGDTIKNDLQWGYDNKKEFVKRALQNALSSIHIVPDNWTSPNSLGVIGFTVQFVTEDHGLQSLVVRIKELQGQHSGENMAEAIMEFIREYGIASKVGYFMMDNATNMNTMIDKVSDDLEHEFDVFYDPLPHRLRCFGHIVNLAVMEFLIGKRPPTTDSYRGPSDEEVEQWRKRGAIGKLHNIVVYVMWTPPAASNVYCSQRRSEVTA
ncbi:hypothetical protein H9L39_19453 [Fusarium oxysporum f. sp. albedinis]|nr:hypothetical protein H9L39_19453 [Fusarium oxysporum f. sp. albedinis]